jgi:hypothetical protein
MSDTLPRNREGRVLLTRESVQSGQSHPAPQSAGVSLPGLQQVPSDEGAAVMSVPAPEPTPPFIEGDDIE